MSPKELWYLAWRYARSNRVKINRHSMIYSPCLSLCPITVHPRLDSYGFLAWASMLKRNDMAARTFHSRITQRTKNHVLRCLKLKRRNRGCQVRFLYRRCDLPALENISSEFARYPIYCRSSLPDAWGT